MTRHAACPVLSGTKYPFQSSSFVVEDDCLNELMECWDGGGENSFEPGGCPTSGSTSAGRKKVDPAAPIPSSELPSSELSTSELPPLPFAQQSSQLVPTSRQNT